MANFVLLSSTKIRFMGQSNETKYMRRAIYLAERAEAGAVSPNPKVGAVLVHEGRVISEGYHQRVGEAHAEVDCLKCLKPADQHLLKASTMYVTLEPCAHEGRTPSCAKRLASEGIYRVVVGTLDPNPLVAGKGVAILREAGVKVEVGVLEKECRKLARVFLTNYEQQRPYILLKWAESTDGFIDFHRTSATTQPAKFSTPFTCLLLHRLRSQYSGILVGGRTFELDRPQLNNRLWTPSPYSPQPILLSTHTLSDLPPHWWQIQSLSQSALTDVSGDAMQSLLNRGITSLMVEGGATTLEHFISLGLWDEIRREVAPITICRGVKAPELPPDAVLYCSQAFPPNTIYHYIKP